MKAGVLESTAYGGVFHRQSCTVPAGADREPFQSVHELRGCPLKLYELDDLSNPIYDLASQYMHSCDFFFFYHIFSFSTTLWGNSSLAIIVDIQNGAANYTL